MNQGIKYTGCPSREELENSPGYPSTERVKKGPVAIIECVEEIPCDPCETACPYGAIKVGEPITNLPTLLEDECIGCGVCIAKCPGLAIFWVDLTYSKDEALVAIPYEYLPLPQPGERVEAVSREGKTVTQGRIVKVDNRKRNDRTAVIHLAVKPEFAQEVRGVRVFPKRNS